jgi:tRNA1(Val) A37 N6-methylase TrmN6
MDERVKIITRDVEQPDLFSLDGLAPGEADRVLMNPPFNDPARQQISPDAARERAHASRPDTLERWVAAAARALTPRGILTMIWRADGLADVVTALSREFGSVMVMPVHPRPLAPAIRVLVRASKGGKSPLAMLPGLELNDAQGRPSAAAEAVLRAGGVLPLANL